MCISWCTNQMTLRNERCNDKEKNLPSCFGLINEKYEKNSQWTGRYIHLYQLIIK